MSLESESKCHWNKITLKLTLQYVMEVSGHWYAFTGLMWLFLHLLWHHTLFKISYMLFLSAQGREDNMSSTYDTFDANHIPGLQQLTQLPLRVRAGSLTVEEALERLNDWQRVQKGMNAIQQARLSHTPGSCSTANKLEMKPKALHRPSAPHALTACKKKKRMNSQKSMLIQEHMYFVK